MHNTPFFSPPEHEEGLGLQGKGLTAPIHHQLCFLTFFRMSTLITPGNHPTTPTLNKNVQKKQKNNCQKQVTKFAKSLPRTTISKQFSKKNNPEQLIAKYCFEQQFARFTKELSGVTLNNKKLSVTTFCKSSRKN